jgi:hypothetical protein
VWVVTHAVNVDLNIVCYDEAVRGREWECDKYGVDCRNKSETDMT